MILNELNKSIDYIDENLTKELNLLDISNFVGLPAQHYRNLFIFLSGIGLSEYIKKRKLYFANKDLLNNEPVTNVATKYGYSMDGFTRTFKAWSGYLPSQIHENQVLISYPKLSFFVNVTGGINMKTRIVQQPKFNIVGIQKRVPMQFEGVNKDIDQLANSITEQQKKEMHHLQDMEPKEIVNVSYNADEDFTKEEGYLTHMVGVLTTKNDISSQMDVIHFNESKWVVFENEGEFPKTLQDTYAKIYSEWLPDTEYTLSDVPMFSFTKFDSSNNDFAYSEIWVAVSH
ncbi:AraC family transcriptional regulator [Staphylococcus nepalensis]|uniref:AraC family transcriptional regulator n=2 Tax=Staphylococcus nepalensis TaxID=214473 RepID=A0ABS3KXV4_9STAP|nr:AraC family transcriptional regulator [Staphylococcus nepalensis]MBO1213298.1 AraC family transcriptional regulator [Staphylococcus nepalensis]MBO1215480.1 AraC family transcriptional regulator [Staphylococcus nepalensis]MBO1226122.1 AraC family transcriptional regulator [Staphylococcus nepalensis]MBO1234550.1 AraC family transcriptional regulator [Staphylococcus nepalensis]MBO1238664.1 AraC family transcriptional regulator [Staphylococcus nepalensis]